MINKIGHISDSRNKKLKNHRYEVARAKNSLQYRVARDIKEQNSSANYNFNDGNYDKGMEWFNSGLPLEEAPIELRQNGSFIKGFQRGKTLKLVNDSLYQLGQEYFLKGIDFDDVPDNYKDKEAFKDGYNDALNNRHR